MDADVKSDMGVNAGTIWLAHYERNVRYSPSCTVFTMDTTPVVDVKQRCVDAAAELGWSRMNTWHRENMHWFGCDAVRLQPTVRDKALLTSCLLGGNTQALHHTVSGHHGLLGKNWLTTLAQHERGKRFAAPGYMALVHQWVTTGPCSLLSSLCGQWSGKGIQAHDLLAAHEAGRPMPRDVARQVLQSTMGVNRVEAGAMIHHFVGMGYVNKLRTGPGEYSLVPNVPFDLMANCV